MSVGKAESTIESSPGSISDTELFAIYRSDRSADNRNRIVSKYLYLADVISRKFINRGIDYEDIHQVAAIALIKAAERFDPEKGVKFVSFATPTVIGEIKRYFRDKGSVIRIPRRVYEIYQKVNHAKDYLTHQLKRVPRADEIAAYLSVSEETVLEIMESWNAHNMQSFNQNAYPDDDIELHETIGSEDTAFEMIENRDFIRKSLDKFSDIERKFIEMRYFEGRTQKQIAEQIKVSQMYVSRLERKVLGKFRNILEK